MTTPFQFPNIQQGSTIMDPGIGGSIASGLAAVLKAQQDAQELKRQQAEFESKQVYYKTLNEGNQLENEQKRQGLKKTQRDLEAKGIANDAFAQWAGSGAKFDDVGKIVASGRFKGNPEAAQAFVTSVHDHFTNLNAAAEAQKSQVQADVATKTAPDVVSKAGSEATKSASDAKVATATEGAQIADATAIRQLHQAQAAKALSDAKQPQDVSSRINAAINTWKTGAVTLGDAFKAAGAPMPEGADPKEKFDPSSQGRSMAVFKAQAKAAAAQAIISGSQVDQLLGGGVKITRWTPLKEGIPFGLGRSSIPENEQALLAAGGQYVSQFVLAVSGKAATDKEREFIMRQIIPMSGDKPLVEKQKTVMREAFAQIMYDASQGANRPMSQIIESTIGAAKSRGADSGLIKFLDASRMKAMQMERDRIKTADSLTAPLLTADTQPSTPDSLNAMLQGYGR